MSGRIDIPVNHPKNIGEPVAVWTGRLLGAGQFYGVNRQCSIGYHDECSDPYGESCMCSCHALGITLTRDQLEAWAGRDLSDDEVLALEEAIPNSSIPESVATIADNL